MRKTTREEESMMDEPTTRESEAPIEFDTVERREMERHIEDGEYIEEYGTAESLDVPLAVRRDGYEYHWARRDVYGMNDFNLEAMSRRAWRPVDAWRDPSYMTCLTNADEMAKLYICKSDCVLVERPDRYRIKEDVARRSKYNDRMYAMVGVENKNTKTLAHNMHM